MITIAVIATRRAGKKIHKIKDEELVRDRPETMFEQDQETSTAGKVVSKKAETRHGMCVHRSDWMGAQDGTLYRGERNAAKTKIHGFYPREDCDVQPSAMISAIKMTNSNALL